ncbi:haloalkane dehalogenase [Aestuariibius sp. HNIBRBA575]|uniref:haloalkane dehalogenase n=1 Tax=Aestuariibius sp. HNIBRBA575 TaxID=3233343 RepID=UPI0034A5980D
MSSFRDRKKFATVFGNQMAYIEEGEGDPIVFLHGNPTSSYLWRNIMPYLAGKGRLIAPDLIGMGDSDKLENSGPDRYTYAEQRKYLFALLQQLDVTENVTLVLHDWGSSLGFDWASKNESALKGIAFMEAAVKALQNWDSFSDEGRALFEGFRSPAGEEMVLENNIFVEGFIPAAVLRDMSEEDLNEYRRPFLNAGEDRRPMLTFPRQIPIAGDPADVAAVVDAYSEWLGKTDIPKLFVNAEPGIILTGELRDFARSLSNVSEVTVPGLHYIQEDSPDEIGAAIRDWLDTI